MRLQKACFTVVLLGIIFSFPAYCGETKSSREKSQFDIYMNDKKIGEEKYSIEVSPDSISSKSTVKFKDPSNKRQEIKIETTLSMDSHYMPLTYKAKTMAGKDDKEMKCTFAPGYTDCVYRGVGEEKKVGLMAGASYTILDANIFHHFIFIARLFDFSDASESQSIEVVNPQEVETGILKINNVGSEEISLRNKKKELYHLEVDSGQLQIDLWIDKEHMLYKIALPTKHIEIIRKL